MPESVVWGDQSRGDRRISEQSERKIYLDSQHADISESLVTLENAIRKIDRKPVLASKRRSIKVNTGLQEKFPRLFGGGHAYLQLTGEDLLDTGVTVMARPPGKKFKYSAAVGWEKALTAVALVFAILSSIPHHSVCWMRWMRR